MFTYSVAIRTLGKGGGKYLKTLQSVYAQTIKPTSINVYIPYGYDLPKESIGIEKYYRCNKGMIAQRALRYTEIEDEWILFLDDDMYLPSDYIQKNKDFIDKSGADVITANVFPNHNASLIKKLVAATHSVFPFYSKKWGFKVTRAGRYIYNNNPKDDFMLSQTGSGSCILCRKKLFLSIHFEDELWMDKFGYALGDDQLMNYKLYLNGGKEYVYYNSGVVHLNAGGAHRKNGFEYIKNSNACLFLVWYRSIYKLNSNSFLIKLWVFLCYSLSILFKLLTSILYILKGIYSAPFAIISGVITGIRFTRSDIYRQYPFFDRHGI